MVKFHDLWEGLLLWKGQWLLKQRKQLSQSQLIGSALTATHLPIPPVPTWSTTLLPFKVTTLEGPTETVAMRTPLPMPLLS